MRTPYFSIKVKLNGGVGNRIGVVAGKAAAGAATKRNFLKRQARAELQKIISSGRDFLLIISPSVKGLTKKDIHIELVRAIQKAHL